MPAKIGALISIDGSARRVVPACPVLADTASGARRLFGMRSGRRWGWRPALFYGLGWAKGETAYHPHLHTMAAREAAVETYKGDEVSLGWPMAQSKMIATIDRTFAEAKANYD